MWWVPSKLCGIKTILYYQDKQRNYEDGSDIEALRRGKDETVGLHEWNSFYKSLSLNESFNNFDLIKKESFSHLNKIISIFETI